MYADFCGSAVGHLESKQSKFSLKSDLKLSTPKEDEF